MDADHYRAALDRRGRGRNRESEGGADVAARDVGARNRGRRRGIFLSRPRSREAACGIKKPLYNIMYGPPIFAPLLFAACGTIGLLASLMRRER